MLIVTFMQNSFNISDEVDGSASNYTIIYSDSTFGSICGSAMIPSSVCVGGICSHMFNVFTSSSCPSSTGITVTVFATNVLGNGPLSDPLTIG